MEKKTRQMTSTFRIITDKNLTRFLFIPKNNFLSFLISLLVQIVQDKKYLFTLGFFF